MVRGRNAVIGWLTYTIGKRVVKRAVRRKVRSRFAAVLDAEAARRPTRRRLPLLGAGLAVAAAAAAALAVRSRRTGGE